MKILTPPHKVEHEIGVEDDGVIWIRAFVRQSEDSERKLRFTGTYKPLSIRSIKSVVSKARAESVIAFDDGMQVHVYIAHNIVAEQWKVARDRWRAAHGSGA